MLHVCQTYRLQLGCAAMNGQGSGIQFKFDRGNAIVKKSVLTEWFVNRSCCHPGTGTVPRVGLLSWRHQLSGISAPYPLLQIAELTVGTA